ncbi:MAG TPA: right-handed parallel beta-helix repeat-containing protein [Prolixibacteraceae bacterium]|nr:right-handed parallel beta-helix repeat-containing protein [Prolixibacteraceae bacterium]
MKSKSFYQLFLPAFLLIMLTNFQLTASTFYVDSQSGNDSHPGTREQPFQTIEKVNSLKLQPGYSVYFAGGQTFNGTLRLKSLTGTKDQSIIIGSFGNGRAILNGGSDTAVQADSCSWLQIKNLILTGNGRLSKNRGSGVELRHVQNCRIDSIEAKGFFWSGVKAVGGQNLRITHVYAHDNGFSGINVESDGQDSGGLEGSGQKTLHNLYIANCVAENNPGCPEVKENHSGNGILIGGVTNGTIEYCEAMNNGWDMPREGNGPVGIWAYQSDSITIQYCYSHDNKTSATGKDGGGFDFDGGVTNSVMQFNLSANNEGAGYGLFQYYEASAWKNNIIRNNISFNDGRKNGQAGFLMWIAPGSPELMSDCEIYENTVVNEYGHAVSFEPGDYPGFNFRNNIFIITNKFASIVHGNYSGATFENNQAWSTSQKVPFAFPEVRQVTPSDPGINIPATDKPHN